jgi:hypothetical protein
MSYRQDTAACVSLSKSTMSKTGPVSRTRRLRPAAARSGVSRRSEVFVNRLGGALCLFSGRAESEAQNSLRGRF